MLIVLVWLQAQVCFANWHCTLRAAQGRELPGTSPYSPTLVGLGAAGEVTNPVLSWRLVAVGTHVLAVLGDTRVSQGKHGG